MCVPSLKPPNPQSPPPPLTKALSTPQSFTPDDEGGLRAGRSQVLGLSAQSSPPECALAVC